MNWLRISFWVAAIADFIIAIMVLIPDRPGVDTYVISMGQMSAVAFSWGVMLILAAIKPMERRWIAVPTLLVVFLLAMVSVPVQMAFNESSSYLRKPFSQIIDNNRSLAVNFLCKNQFHHPVYFQEFSSIVRVQNIA